jgi:O-antigen/teichoic acid export membrane protein
MSSNAQFLRNSLMSYACLVMSSLCGFLMVPITLGYLGQTQYGLLHLIGSLTAYISLGSLGIGTAVMRTVAQARSEGRETDLSRTVSTALFFYLGIAIIGMIGALAFLPFLPDVFHLPPDQVRPGQWALVITVAGSLVTFPLSAYRGVLTGRERFDIINAMAITLAVAWLGLGWLVLRLGGGLLAFLGALTVLNGAGEIVLTWFAHREVPALRVSGRHVSGTELKSLLSFGLFMFCIHVMGQVSAQAGSLIIGAFLPLGMIAVYNVGMRLSDLAKEIPAQIARLLPPVIARQNLDDPKAPHHTVVLVSTRWLLVIALAAVLPLLAFGGPLIRAWVGPGFAEAPKVTAILCVIAITGMSYTAMMNVLMLLGRHRFMAGLAIGSSAATILLSIVLVRWFGVVGMAIGTTIPVLVNGAVILPVGCRYIDLRIRRLVRQALLPALLPAPVVLGVALAAQGWLGIEGLPRTVGAMTATAAAYLGLFAMLGATAEDRTILGNQWKTLRRGLETRRWGGTRSIGVASKGGASD